MNNNFIVGRFSDYVCECIFMINLKFLMVISN